MTDAQPETSTDPVRDTHEFALEAHIRLGMRTGKARDPQTMWAYASGTAAAWALHRTLARLAEVDPEGVKAFAAQLIEEGEWPELGDDPVEVAQRMGFDAQGWIDVEFARQDELKAAAARGIQPHRCGNCEGVDPATCLMNTGRAL